MTGVLLIEPVKYLTAPAFFEHKSAICQDLQMMRNRRLGNAHIFGQTRDIQSLPLQFFDNPHARFVRKSSKTGCARMLGHIDYYLYFEAQVKQKKSPRWGLVEEG